MGNIIGLQTRRAMSPWTEWTKYLSGYLLRGGVRFVMVMSYPQIIQVMDDCFSIEAHENYGYGFQMIYRTRTWWFSTATLNDQRVYP